MPMVPFYSKVGQRALEEMRTVMVMQGESLLSGHYAFVEFYCNEVDCECRRVLLQVVRADTGRKVWATINFGWETPAYYQKWSRGRQLANEMASATLEPLATQTRYSQDLLRLFTDHVQPDGAYVARLKEHYAEVKRLCSSPTRNRRPPGRKPRRG